jgi:pilus assembly protein Flp/PilA
LGAGSPPVLSDRKGLGEPSAGCSEELSMKYLVAFLRNESGATAIEYGLIAAGISVAIIVAVQGVGTNLSGTFKSVQNALN